MAYLLNKKIFRLDHKAKTTSMQHTKYTPEKEKLCSKFGNRIYAETY